MFVEQLGRSPIILSLRVSELLDIGLSNASSFWLWTLLQYAHQVTWNVFYSLALKSRGKKLSMKARRSRKNLLSSLLFSSSYPISHLWVLYSFCLFVWLGLEKAHTQINATLKYVTFPCDYISFFGHPGSLSVLFIWLTWVCWTNPLNSGWLVLI